MLKKITVGLIAGAAISLSLATPASADPTTPAKPDPLSAAGLGLHIPELSAQGLLNHGQPFAYPPLSAGGICHYVFHIKDCGKVPS
jgi:hypothetical protein